MKINTLLLLLISFILSSHTYAFHFEFLFIKDPVHQEMAEKALRCVAENPQINEMNCENFNVKGTSKRIDFDINEMTELTVDDIQEAITWADDPVRELRKRKFVRALLWTFRLLGDECEGKRGGLKDGLRCSTHYGDFQFMHSMENEDGISAEETQKAILDWIEYSYKVAINKQDSIGFYNDNDYCDFFSVKNQTKFQKAMRPTNSAGISEFPCKVIDDTPWELATPFAFSCTLGSVNCTEYSNGNDFLVRKAALGAVLHAIQDSYAKGHASRGNDVADAINTYECSPIRQFQLYTKQDHDKHGDADKTPTPSNDCLNAENDIHGPVTASAEVIRLFSQGAESKTVIEYLKEHVYKLADTTYPSGTTNLFIKRI